MAKSLIISGSRPDRLYGYSNKDNHAKYQELRKKISDYIKDNGITDVYTTCDLGAETIGAEAAVNAKASLHVLEPYNDRDAKWKDDVKKNYEKIKQYATDVTPITGKDYDRDALKARLDFLRELAGKEDTSVLMVYDGADNDNCIYTMNTLAKVMSDKGEQMSYLQPQTLNIGNDRPYPVRERIVSEERINEIKNHGEKYTKEERQDMSEIWHAYLDKLTLRDEHKKDLMERGFTEEQIARYKYKSLPQNKKEAEELVKSMMDDGYDLTKAPGFSIAEDGGAITTQCMKDAYFCPAFDTGEQHKGNDMLYGMQIRNCDPEGAKKYGKYTWFSKSKGSIGLSSSQPAAFYKGKNPDVILITEGVLKCNLAFEAMGEEYSICGMAGVFGEKGLYPYDEREQFKDKVILECFDADYVKNKNVRAASERIRNNLIDFHDAKATARMTWDDSGKGIDDYVSDKNRAAEDVHFDVSKIIEAGSSTYVKKDEWGKNITVHEEVDTAAGVPKQLDVDMKSVRANGFGIQQKSAEQLAKESEKAAAKAKEPKETKKEHYERKKITHFEEWSGRRDAVIRTLLPATITQESEMEKNAGKFVVTMPESSNADLSIKQNAKGIAEYAKEIMGLPEDNRGNVYVTDATDIHNDRKAIAIVFKDIGDDIKKAGAAVKGAMLDCVGSAASDLSSGRTFPVTDGEFAYVTGHGGNGGNDGPKTPQTDSATLNEGLVNENAKDMSHDVQMQ